MEPELHNKLSSYKIDDNVRVDFDAEVQSWVDEGILQAVPRDCYVESVVPMMAVVQHVKGVGLSCSKQTCLKSFWK